MARTNLEVQDLDFNRIKESLKEFLRADPQFTDYDFEGSSLTVLLNLMAYNTHYLGFYAHMLANEAFIDSANQKSSMTSKAKLLNYVPGSKNSSEAVVTFDVDIDAGNEPADKKIVIERGSTILSDNNDTDTRTFVVVDDVVIYNSSLTGGYDYSSDEVTIYEGTFEEERFIRDSSQVNQRFILRNSDIDTTTLRVRVYNARGDTEYTTYTLAEDYAAIDGDSPVYFVTVNEDDYYELTFGNDVYGKALDNNNYISCTYVATNGESGNNARSFTFGGDYTYNGNPYLITIATVSNSTGGLPAETIDELRFNIPYHYRRQNRAVTIDDYHQLLMAEYRNINSMNVWGGEDHYPVTYGKVFICIKPIYGEVLSSKAKENIINNIIKPKNIATVDVEIVDPEYLYVNLAVTVRYNPINTDLSNGQIVTLASAAVDTYDTDVLNRFEGFYSDVDLNYAVKSTNSSILTSFTARTLERRFTPVLNSSESYTVNFLNALQPNGVISDEFQFRLQKSYFKDDGSGNIVVYWYNEATSEYEMYADETFGAVDYDEGIVTLVSLEISSIYSGNTYVRAYAQAVEPDFYTRRNTIVSINETTVTAEEYSGNESEKA